MILTVPSCGTLRVITTQVPMIGSTAHFPYYEDENVQVVSLPLKNNKMQVLIILPKQMFGLAELEEQLTGDKLISYINALEEFDEVMVMIPKISTGKVLDLSGGLKNMGLQSIFNQSANFSGISSKALCVTKNITNTAFLEMNEEGISTDKSSCSLACNVMTMDKYFYPALHLFDASHPFLYAISDSQNNILWIGRYSGEAKAPRDENLV
uniref:SERPIN domain-containing protein n=1 Tax=Elaeophora elaphi TaxID=1147741 RepID=A0A0R3RN62_9BILA